MFLKSILKKLYFDNSFENLIKHTLNFLEKLFNGHKWFLKAFHQAYKNTQVISFTCRACYVFFLNKGKILFFNKIYNFFFFFKFL